MYCKEDDKNKCWDCMNKDFAYEQVFIDGTIRYIEKE